jgi:acetyl esterase/lipase
MARENDTLTVPLWEGRPPGALGEGPGHEPFLDVHLPPPDLATGAAMLILPGGSYSFLSDKSGYQYGRWLAEAGISGFVVNFRLGSDGYRHSQILADGWRALETLHERAGTWGLDPARIGVIGTSAGGHLAAMLLTGVGAASGTPRPALGVLCYPVISMRDDICHAETRGNFLGDAPHLPGLQEEFSAELQVDEHTPPCFVWHTLADEEVTAENSLRFLSALAARGLAYETHLYERGAHALGLARAEGLHWSHDCVRWLRSHGF